jgi:extradiol dioxygenase family protein
MRAVFHLSIGVRLIEESVRFFTEVMNGTVSHRDPSGYVNIDLFGNEITLKPNKDLDPHLVDFHFGINLGLGDFDKLTTHIMEKHRNFVVMVPKTVDAGTALERKKMYLKCPTGYQIELKGYGS